MTAQLPDGLKYKGQWRSLCANPLESFFDSDNLRPDFKSPHTACWRGYVAEWEVEDDTLYLVGLEGWVGGDEDTYAVNARSIGLEDLFPWAAGRVKATWFTGELRVPQGNLLEDDFDFAYGRIYEENLLLFFHEGKLVRTEIKDNRHLIPEIRKRQRRVRRKPRRRESGDLQHPRIATSATTQECPFCHKRLSIDYEPGAKLSCSDCGASLTIDPSRKAVGGSEGEEV